MPPNTRMELLRMRQPSSEYQIADEDYTDFMMDIVLLRANGVMESSGVLIDEQWIDMARIKSWLRFCDGKHQDSYSRLAQGSNIPLVKTLLLMDVEYGCLVWKSGTVRYFALSYVWGHLVDTAETRLCNFDGFTKPGVITADTKSLNLPETIRDAIRLVQNIGERFLWVDRLCIIQNDYDNKTKAIQEMGSIYANSQCTIVAAVGQDADYGLRGVRNGSQPRSCPQSILNFPHCPVLQQQDLHADRKSLWSTRGWTCQEQLCSRRLLIFAGNTVIWRCQRSEWREDITAEPEGAERPPLLDGNETMLRFYSWPNLIQWRDLIGYYNNRQLSFQSDTCAAFACIEKIVSRSFPGGFCYGLPELFFDAGLLWQSLRPLIRRASPTHGNKAMKDSNYLPSWSWLGWKGSLDPLGWIPGLDYLESLSSNSWSKQSTLKVMPLVDWIQLGPLMTTARARLVSSVWSKASIKPGGRPPKNQVLAKSILLL